MGNSEDLHLIKNISQGDSKSFESLMLKYQKLVYGFNMKMLKNKEIAEDITQETWVKLVRNAHQFKPTGSVKSWVLSISRNLVIDHFRQTKKWMDLDDEKWDSIADTQSDIEELFALQERSEALKSAFDELSENQKIILSMILIEELNQSEVSVKLGISVGAVKASLFRAREQLRKTMGVKNEQE